MGLPVGAALYLAHKRVPLRPIEESRKKGQLVHAGGRATAKNDAGCRQQSHSPLGEGSVQLGAIRCGAVARRGKGK